MKKNRKLMKNYRIRPDLVAGINNLSERLDCTKTKILETALERFIQETVLESKKSETTFSILTQCQDYF